jgi:hypothetical protein
MFRLYVGIIQHRGIYGLRRSKELDIASARRQGYISARCVRTYVGLPNGNS